MKHFDHISLLTQKLDGGLSTSEQAQLDSWLSASDQNQSEHDFLEQIWEDAAGYEPPADLNFDSSAAFSKFKATVIDVPGVNPVPEATGVLGLGKMLTYAIALVLATAVAYYLLNNVFGTVTNNNTGEVKNIVLENGSNVWLDDQSAITEVEDQKFELEGKVYVDGTDSNDKMSFNIGTQSITSQGASYSVNAKNEALTQINVEQGSILVSAENGEELIVSEGQRVEIHKDGTVTQTELVTDNAFSWKAKTLEFNNTPLPIVFEDLQDYYGISIFDNNFDLSNCNFTSPKLTNTQLNVVLEILKESHKVEFETASKGNYSLTQLDCK